MSTLPGAWLRPLFRSAHLLCGLLLCVLAAPLCAAAPTYYVSPSGNDNNAGTQASPFKTIQQGINNAATGDTVTLTDGTYTGPANVDIDAQGKSITVNSVNGASTTIIDCGGTSTTNHRAFYFHSNESAAVITGITMKNSYEGKNDGNGGAVYVSAGCTVTLTNCTFSSNTNIGNYGGVNGGGVGNNGTVTLTNCNFSGNTARIGGGLSNTGTATLTGCTLNGNTAGSGGGIYNTGTLTLTSCTASSNSGDGVYNGGGLTLLNCITSNNSGRGVDNSSGTVTLTNCTLNSNGGGFFNGYRATLTNCTISGNTITAGDGGGVNNTENFGGSYLQMTGCTMTGNMATHDVNNNAGLGGGLYNPSSAASLTNCVISGSTAYNSGGGVYNSGQVTLTNCVVAGNKTTVGNGGGIYNYPGDAVTLRFCTLSGNSTQAASSQGGALENDGTVTLTDDILWANTAPSFAEIGIASTGNPVTTVTYSDIQGGLSGTGNLKADPLFVNAANDFRLKAGSPCIGAGVAITGSSGVTTDLEGNARANPPTIGAYEGGIAVAGHTHLLWNNSDGRVMLWSVAQDGTFTLNGFGPYTDNAPQNKWSATALATGADGKSHILWNNTDGRVMLWTVDDSGNFTLAGYGPYTDNAPQNIWHAVAVSVGPDNVVHLLWSNTDHRAMLWNVDSAFNFTLAGYGPYTDNAPNNLWTATALATGPDNIIRILWGNTDHRAMLWNVNADFSFTLAGYGPYTDNAPQNLWDAIGVSVGPDSLPHLLWNNSDRRAMFWDLDGSFNLTALTGYGPYTDNAPGNLWSVTGLATGADGMSHLLWNNTDNRVMLWGVDNAGNFTVTGYGPYTDNAPGNLWSATAVSAGP